MDDKFLKLSKQAQMSFVMVLQKGLMENRDMSSMLEELLFYLDGEELVCVNPPVINMNYVPDTEYSEGGFVGLEE